MNTADCRQSHPAHEVTKPDANTLPRRIWTLWAQGLAHMPAVPRACVETWTAHNPDWDVKILTAETLHHWVDPLLCEPAANSLRPYRLSELARVNLLARHGGVWVDATCYCMKPLDQWLADCLDSSFFAFSRPGPDRLMASWFLASPSNGYIPSRLWDTLYRYYLGHDFSDTGWRQLARRALDKTLNHSTRTTSLWFAPPLPQLKISPYLSFHYKFTDLTRVDPAFREIWNKTATISADGPHSLQFHGLDRPPSPEILADFAQQRVPLYKLDWRVDPSALSASSTLRALLAQTA